MKAPFSTRSELDAARPARIADQLRYELQKILVDRGLTQEELALELGYGTGASVSRWLSGVAVVSVPAATKLDELYGPTTLDASFADLVQAYRRATRRAKRPTLQAPRQHASFKARYDVFLASPMAALAKGQSFEKEREWAIDLAAAIEQHCGLTVYYAGWSIPGESEFDAANIALDMNVSALRDAEYFAMLILTPPQRPSSVLVEAGFALAMGLPSVYFVKSLDVLPYILREAPQHASSRALPPVHIHQIERPDQAVALLRHHKAEFFTQLRHPH